MAFFYQLHTLKQEVQQQLLQLDDVEKGTRQSGDTADPPISISDSQRATTYDDIPGVKRVERSDGSTYFLVSFASPTDPQNPRNWSMRRRLKTTFMLLLIAFGATAASAIDSAVTDRAARDFSVSTVAEVYGATGSFLTGFGLGSLLNSPLSEFAGRFPTYLCTLTLFGIWLVGSGLAPDLGSQIAFRFLAGLFSSAPLTVAGGSISDLWNAQERTFAFPLMALGGFGGPLLGPVMGAFIGQTHAISWRWVEWIMLIITGATICIVLAFMEETLAPRVLKYKARFFRTLTGDGSFLSPSEATGDSTVHILERNFMRPFQMAVEPIILLFTIYIAVVFILLFTFLDGYSHIFSQTYGIGTGLTNTIFIAMFIGVVLHEVIIGTYMYRGVCRFISAGSPIPPEHRLYFAMVGAPCIPVGLFWMGWTCFPHISIWSPICASVLVGFGIIGIFLSAYMYIIDCYEAFAASALTFNSLARYLCAAGMTVVGVPMYDNLGPHYTITILASISIALVPVPFALYKWGPTIRSRSKFAVD